MLGFSVSYFFLGLHLIVTVMFSSLRCLVFLMLGCHVFLVCFLEVLAGNPFWVSVLAVGESFLAGGGCGSVLIVSAGSHQCAYVCSLSSSCLAFVDVERLRGQPS